MEPGKDDHNWSNPYPQTTYVVPFILNVGVTLKQSIGMAQTV